VEEALAQLGSYAGGTIPPARLAAKEAELLADLNRVDEAETLLEDLAESSDVSSLLAAAEVYQRQNRYGEAVPVLARALERAGDSIYIRYWLGAAYERSGNKERATEIFRDLLGIDPHYAPALNYLGYMAAERGENLEEAIELVDQALAQEPDNGAYVDSLGWAHFQLGNYSQARGLLERAARLLPDDPTIREHLGDVYSATAEPDLAREAYVRAIALDGDNRSQVEDKLQRIPEGR
jgi:tetratricopeptide (TPR) repeat protein